MSVSFASLSDVVHPVPQVRFLEDIGRLFFEAIER